MTLERHQIAWWTAGSFAILATLITMVQVAYHLQWTTHKYIRRYVIRIIIMVPIYGLESWLGLRFKDQAMYFALLRECYEALVIYSFYQLLVTWLGGEEKLTVMLAEKPSKAHMTPFCCLRPWSMTNGAENPSEMHSDFFLYTQIGTLQYCIMKPLLGLIAFICEVNHVYEDGKFLPDKGWPYVTFFANMSQVWAMYCLIMFYMVFKDDLRPIRPIPKFLVVKAVVFFTFWQGVLLAILVRVGLLTPTETYTEDEIVSGLQDFIVCMEMTIAAIAHHFAFTHKDFLDPSAPATRAPVLRAVFEVVNVTDVYVNEVRKVTKRVTKKNATRTVTSSASSALGPTSPSNPYVALTEPLTDTPGADEQQQQQHQHQQQQQQQQHGAVHIHVMESDIESRTRNGSHHRLVHTESLSVEWDGSMNGDPDPNSRPVADDDDNDTRYRQQHMTLPSLTSDEQPLVEL